MKKNKQVSTAPPGSMMTGERLVAAARAWDRDEKIELDFDDPHLDERLQSLDERIRSIVGEIHMFDFVGALRLRASCVASVQTAMDGTEYRVERDLMMFPAVGPAGDVDDLAADAGRMRAIAEIGRRSGLLPRSEDIFLLPVVIDAKALATPTLAGIRKSAILMAECLDADDLYDDARMMGMAEQVATNLGARVAGTPVPGGRSVDPAIHAFVGIAGMRFMSSEESVPLEPINLDQTVDEMLHALTEVSGRAIRIGGPGSWAATTTAAVKEFLDIRFATLRAMNGFPPTAPIRELRHAVSEDGRDLVVSIVLGDRVLGPVSVPLPLARKMKRYMATFCENNRSCFPRYLMVPPEKDSSDTELVWPRLPRADDRFTSTAVIDRWKTGR